MPPTGLHPTFALVFCPCLGGCGRRSGLNESWTEREYTRTMLKPAVLVCLFIGAWLAHDQAETSTDRADLGELDTSSDLLVTDWDWDWDWTEPRAVYPEAQPHANYC